MSPLAVAKDVADVVQALGPMASTLLDIGRAAAKGDARGVDVHAAKLVMQARERAVRMAHDARVKATR